MPEEKRERNTAIIDAVRNGATLEATAQQWGITRERVRQICRRVGVYTQGTEWLTPEEEQKIRALYARGMRPAHIAAEVARPSGTVANVLTRLGLRQKDRDGILYHEWTPYENEMLCALYGQQSTIHIAELLGRSKNEVIGRAHRLGLGKKANPPRLITVNGETRSISEWARHVGIPKGHIYRRIALGWRPEMAILAPIEPSPGRAGRAGVREKEIF